MGLGPPTPHENGLAYAGRGSGNVALSWYARVRNESDVGAFGTTAVELLALRDWLEAHGVTHVAMESTGVYWKPVFYVLEEAFTCLLVNAAHIKQVPGRKTDVKDCMWIAQCLEHGLLRGSFVPPAAIREIRDLTDPVLFRPYPISRTALLPVASGVR